MYKTSKFSIQELVHPQVLSAIGETNSWMRLDEDCLKDLDTIRDVWGMPIYCNRLNLGIDSRGLRPYNDPDGGKYSVHKMGKAFDLEPANGNHQEFFTLVRNLMEDNLLKGFNTMEDRDYTPTWTHVAKMNHDHPCMIIKP